MISSRPFSLMRKPFFPRIWLCCLLPAAKSRYFGTFYGDENRNIIRSFKVAKPWHSNHMLPSKENPKCGHRLTFFATYISDASGSDDFPEFVRNGSNVEVRVSSDYKWIEPENIICFRQMTRVGSGDRCVNGGQKVKIHYELYDNHTYEVIYSTYSKNDPEIIGPGKNNIGQGLYEGIKGMRVKEKRRIVLPPTSDLTGENHKSSFRLLAKIMPKKPSSYSEEHRIYDVQLVEIIG